MMSRIVGTIAVGVFIVVRFGGYASAFEEPIPTKISLLKWGADVGKLYKIVSKPGASQTGGLFQIPNAVTSDPVANGGSLTVTVDAGQLTCNLAGGGNWKALGNPVGSKGYKYVNKEAPSGDLCKIVIVKKKVIKVLAKGVGTIALPVDYPPGNPDVQMVLNVGTDSYCALAEARHDKEKAGTLIKMKDQSAPAECPVACDCNGVAKLSFTTGIPAPGATAGILSNYRCSNAGTSACADDSDCPPGGTCNEVVDSGLPMDLELGALYFGNGSYRQRSLAPDGGKFVMSTSTGDGQTLTLSPTAPGDVGRLHCTQGRTCSNNPGQHCTVDADCAGESCLDNCLYGPPLPVQGAGGWFTPSLCAVTVVGEDASGTAQCDGDVDLTLPLRLVLYLTNDLFNEYTPPNIPGSQPCPLCDTLCEGGDPDERFPCNSDQDCIDAGNTTNLTCGLLTKCLGGPNDGDGCTPGTSDSTALGDPDNSFPTSHDCQNDPAMDLTYRMGGLRTDLKVTTRSMTVNAVDRPFMPRNFCGFCRDEIGYGSSCFEGDTNLGCPVAIPPADGNAVPCASDADCADGDEYESCEQRDPGAFGNYAATRIALTGSTDGQCLGDGQPHAADLASFFCIPPMFDPLSDVTAGFPGPGVELLHGEVRLSSPSGAFMEGTSGLLD